MERITDEQIAVLVAFVRGKTVDSGLLASGGRDRVSAALAIVVDRQIAAIRYYRAAGGGQGVELHAVASWNLLVSIAEVWRDDPDFPVDAAIESFEFEASEPLAPER